MLCAIIEDESFDFPNDQDVEGQVGLLAGHLAAAEDGVLRGRLPGWRALQVEGGFVGSGSGRARCFRLG